MSDLVTDPTDTRLGHGADELPVAQNKAYLVLSQEELNKGFLQPLRLGYIHATCGIETKMSAQIAATYARDPWFYGATYCCGCAMHRPLAEFTWATDGTPMSPRLWDEETSNAVQERKHALAVATGASEK